jgi:hypothetical protein
MDMYYQKNIGYWVLYNGMFANSPNSIKAKLKIAKIMAKVSAFAGIHIPPAAMIVLGYSPITLPDGTIAQGNLIKCVLQYYVGGHNVAKTSIKVGGNILTTYITEVPTAEPYLFSQDNVLGALAVRRNLVPDH